jgi:threonyl-tRNA synthetase
MGHDREHQVATIQLDFNQPESFDLVCINEAGERERIVMIHCAIAGSLERSLGILIEHFAGRFPAWLAPEHIRVATLNQEDVIVDYAQKIVNEGKAMGLRISLDNAQESVGKKIRDAELMKVPYTLVIGGKEVENNVVVPRIRSDMVVNTDHPETSYQEFLKTVANEVKSRVSKSSL